MTSEALERARREFEQRTGRKDILWVNVGECPYELDEPKCAPHWLDTTEIDEAKMDYSEKTNDELRQMEKDAVEKSLAKNRQEGGSHYKDMAIQPYEYCHKNNLGYCESNVIKYVSRWKNKNGVEDLKKARHMLDLLIDEVSDAD